MMLVSDVRCQGRCSLSAMLQLFFRTSLRGLRAAGIANRWVNAVARRCLAGGRQWQCGHGPPAAALPSSSTLSWLVRCTSSSLLLLLLSR